MMVDSEEYCRSFFKKDKGLVILLAYTKFSILNLSLNMFIRVILIKTM